MKFYLSKGYGAGGYHVPGLSNGYGAGNTYFKYKHIDIFLVSSFTSKEISDVFFKVSLVLCVQQALDILMQGNLSNLVSVYF